MTKVTKPVRTPEESVDEAGAQKSAFKEDSEATPRDQKLMGKLATQSSFNATSVMASYQTGAMESLGGADFQEHWPAVMKTVRKVLDGDMNHPQAMLLSQAMTLESMFNALAERAAKNIGVHLPTTEAYMRMALKAQAQCTATLRVLGELKSPKQVAFIKQANVAHGHQQVNNGTPTEPAADAARAHEEKSIQSNELLTEQHGTTLDFGATGGASRGNQTVEAVGEVDRAHD